jgi:hypothetical protein
LLSKESRNLIAGGVAAISGLVSLLWLFWFLAPKAGDSGDWNTLLRFAVAIVLAFAVTAMIRFALSPLVSSDPSPTLPANADAMLRSRMARDAPWSTMSNHSLRLAANAVNWRRDRSSRAIALRLVSHVARLGDSPLKTGPTWHAPF